MPLQSGMPESLARASNASGVASSATITRMAWARRIEESLTQAAPPGREETRSRRGISSRANCARKSIEVGWHYRAAIQIDLRRALRSESGRPRISFAEVPPGLRRTIAARNRGQRRFSFAEPGCGRRCSARSYGGVCAQAEDGIAFLRRGAAAGGAVFAGTDRSCVAGGGRLNSRGTVRAA